MNLKTIYIPDSRDKIFRTSQEAKADINTKLGDTFQTDPQIEKTSQTYCNQGYFFFFK